MERIRNFPIPRIPGRRVVALAGLAAAAILWSATAQAGDALKKGRAAFQRSDFTAAVPLLQQAVSEEPSNIDAHSALAQALIKTHQYDAADKEIAEATRLGPDNPTVPFLQGQLAEGREDWAGAITKYREALVKRSKYADASFALGMALRHEGKSGEALAELNRGLDFAKESEVPKFLSGIGLALMDTDSLSAAADSATRAVALDPENPFTHLALADIYLKRGVWALAKQSLDRATQLDSLNPQVFQKLGLANYYSQSWSEALQAFKTAVALDSLFPDPQYWIGHLYVLAGPADRDRYTQALPYLRNYTRWRPAESRGWSDLGEALYRQQGEDSASAREAAAALEEATRLNPKEAKAYVTLVKLYAYKLKDFDRAFVAYKKAEEIGATMTAEDKQLVASLYVATAAKAAAAKDTETANRYWILADSVFVQAIAADTTKPDGYYKLAESKFFQGRYTEAIPLLMKRMELVDSSGANEDSKLGLKGYVPPYMIGQAYNQLASGYLAPRTPPMPDSAAALFDSAAVWLKKAIAITAMEGVEPRSEDVAKIHLELGTSYVKGSAANRPLAADEFQAAVLADSASKAGLSAIYNLGYIAYGEKRFPDAVAYLERGYAINDQRMDIMVLLAASYVANKDFDKARGMAQKILAIDPNNNIAKSIMKPQPAQKAPAGGAAPKGTAAGKPAVIQAPGATATATRPKKLPVIEVPGATATPTKKK